MRHPHVKRQGHHENPPFPGRSTCRGSSFSVPLRGTKSRTRDHAARRSAEHTRIAPNTQDAVFGRESPTDMRSAPRQTDEGGQADQDGARRGSGTGIALEHSRTSTAARVEGCPCVDPDKVSGLGHPDPVLHLRAKSLHFDRRAIREGRAGCPATRGPRHPSAHEAVCGYKIASPQLGRKRTRGVLSAGCGISRCSSTKC